MAKGYTKINNSMFDALAKWDLTGAEFRVLMAIIRNTMCYHRNQHEISNGFLANATGLSESSVIRAVQSLSDKKIIQIVSAGKGSHPKTIRFLTVKHDTLSNTEGGTVMHDSKRGVIPDSIYTVIPDTQEIKEIKDINKREKKKISFSSLEEMSRYYAEHPEEGGDDGDI